MINIRKTAAAVAAALALSLSMGGAATAQDFDAEFGMAEYSDTQVAAFAAAYIQVAELNMGFESQLAAAGTDEERMTIQVQAQEAMTVAVEQADGITVDEYNAIITQAQNDPELVAQIQAQIDMMAPPVAQ